MGHILRGFMMLIPVDLLVVALSAGQAGTVQAIVPAVETE